ncbi:MAG: hypothetical protein WC797_03160 [Candidatus Paceibacterota bacterium]|jgi:hypothetical protein
MEEEKQISGIFWVLLFGIAAFFDTVSVFLSPFGLGFISTILGGGTFAVIFWLKDLPAVKFVWQLILGGGIEATPLGAMPTWVAVIGWMAVKENLSSLM